MSAVQFCPSAPESSGSKAQNLAPFFFGWRLCPREQAALPRLAPPQNAVSRRPPAPPGKPRHRSRHVLAQRRVPRTLIAAASEQGITCSMACQTALPASMQKKSQKPRFFPCHWAGLWIDTRLHAAEVVELVDTLGSGSSPRKGVGVRVSPSAPSEHPTRSDLVQKTARFLRNRARDRPVSSFCVR